nr:NAD(P)H-binding protein [uncultured Flavobacterium sp.]
MKIIVTGSLGPISKPLAIQLAAKGHEVTVISSNPDKKKEIDALGAKAAIGSIEDIDFLTETFIGADAAYLMEPTVNMFDPTIDLLSHYEKICEKYVQAILNSGLKRIVHLSSIGGHSDTGNGMLAFHYYAEQALKKLPEDVAITTLRPMSFYSNLLAFTPTIKEQNAIITSYHASEPEPWASPIDIAEAAAEELITPSRERKVRYIISDEVSSDQLVKVLGEAIGKEIKWIEIPHNALEESYKNFGMSPQAANGFAKLNEAKNSGTLYEDLTKNRDKVILGKVKMEDFANDFAKAYQNL